MTNAEVVTLGGGNFSATAFEETINRSRVVHIYEESAVGDELNDGRGFESFKNAEMILTNKPSEWPSRMRINGVDYEPTAIFRNKVWFRRIEE